MKWNNVDNDTLQARVTRIETKLSAYIERQDALNVQIMHQLNRIESSLNEALWEDRNREVA